MTTEFVKIDDPTLPEAQSALEKAAEILRSGGLVVFPTETVYGLGGNGLDESAARKIYEAKGRPSDNPLIIHIASPEDAEKYCRTSPLYYKLADAFMPGPLTVIMPKKDIVPLSVTGGLQTVAVRCPSHKTAYELIKKAGVPIAAPSANLSGKPSPTNASFVMEDMDGRVNMVIDGGSCDIGLESTIVMINGEALTLLRPGGITYDALCLVCDDVKIAPAVLEKLADGERPLSPGMKYKHYAPATPVVLLDGEESDVTRFLAEEQKRKKCAILCYDEEIPFLENINLLPEGSRKDLKTQAHRLFTDLRRADRLGCEVIYAHMPKKNGLGLALYNRMIRAAAHTVKKI